MKKLALLLLFALTVLSGYSQQIVNMCDDEKRIFTYTTSSSESGVYFWYINGSLHSSTTASITIDWDLYPLGSYTIDAWFVSESGCSSDPVTFNVNTIQCENSYMYAPNTFTPDGDSFNSEWKPIGWNWKEIHYIIFNRWGEIIFESYDGNVGWDGTYAGRLCQDGVYVYRLKWTDILDKKYDIHGHINLLR